MEEYTCVVCGKKWGSSGRAPLIPTCPNYKTDCYGGPFDCYNKWDRTIEFEGVKVIVDDSAEIKPGDNYLAKRNQEWKLLTCREIGSGCIHPVEMAYSYDTHECFKVIGYA